MNASKLERKAYTWTITVREGLQWISSPSFGDFSDNNKTYFSDANLEAKPNISKLNPNAEIFISEKFINNNIANLLPFVDSINKNKIYSSDINLKIKSNDCKLNPNAKIFISKKIDNNIAKLPSGGRWYSSAPYDGTNSTEAMICDLGHNSNPVYDKKQVTNNNDGEKCGL